MKNELNTCFQQKFATGSYGVGIGRAWCSRKACEICSSLVQKKKLKKKHFSSHKLPKQQSTSFWSQGILGVKEQKHKCLKQNLSTHPFPGLYAVICIKPNIKKEVDPILWHC
jgi:hypothetical protein